MKVVTFSSEGHGSIARIQVMLPAVFKKPARLGYLPVVIHAETCAEARSKAEAFYAAELERFSRKEGSAATRKERLAAARAKKSMSEVQA